jgi:hypothetical protein
MGSASHSKPRSAISHAINARRNGIAAVTDPAYAKPKHSSARPQCRSCRVRKAGIPDADESIEGIQSQGSPEVALNQKVKNLIQKLGEAIHESVSESENIAGVVKNIRDQGFDVMLMLEATIGLNQVESEAGDAAELGAGSGTFTNHDLTFLKSLRISLPDEDPNNFALEPPSDSAENSATDV